MTENHDQSVQLKLLSIVVSHSYLELIILYSENMNTSLFGTSADLIIISVNVPSDFVNLDSAIDELFYDVFLYK